MSISTSIYTSMSGLFTMGDWLACIGDNVANVETTAFKSGRLDFENLLSEAVSSGGVRISQSGFVSDFSTEGPLTRSDLQTHMAISGEGFFILRDAENTDKQYYTRAGEFAFDSLGFLANPDGHVVKGYAFDDQGTRQEQLSDIKIELTQPGSGSENNESVSRLFSSPKASSRFKAAVNLDSDAQDRSKSGLFSRWDGTGEVPLGQDYYELKSEQNIYDSNGDTNLVEVYYDNTSGNNTWEYLVARALDAPGTAADEGVLARGTLSFSANGSLTDMSMENYQQGAWYEAVIGDNGYYEFKTAFEGAENIEFDAGARYMDGQWHNDMQSSTQYAMSSFIKLLDSDGNGREELTGFSVNREGILRADFQNNVSSDLYQLGLADFRNTSGLQRIGSLLYRQDPGEAESPIVDVPGSSGIGEIDGAKLEGSNVDIAKEFGDIIIAQRSFQANSRAISTSDEMLETLVRLKK